MLPFQPVSAPDAVRLVYDDNGLPILFQGKTTASNAAADAALASEQASLYFASLQPPGVKVPTEEFLPGEAVADEQGNLHVRLSQIFKGVEVYGGEVVAHTKKGNFEMVNGRYYPTPSLTSVEPTIHAADATWKVMQHIGPNKAKTYWTPEELQLVGYQPYSAHLVVYHPNRKLDGERLAWQVTARPNVLHRWVYFVDATTGEIIHHFDYTCSFSPKFERSKFEVANSSKFEVREFEVASSSKFEVREFEVREFEVLGAAHDGLSSRFERSEFEVPDAETGPTSNFKLQTSNPLQLQTSNFKLSPPPPDGPVGGTGQDLFNVNRSFGAWQEGNTFYMEDASKLMFNSAGSQMPNKPAGAIVTLDAKNTSPATNAFSYDLVKSTSTTFTNKAAVSAHWNSIKSYDYFQNTFTRKSIDGVGGNILAFFNVAEDDGSSMENAFWNGNAMWYGNGGSAFKPLARGLDVGGHEMTHGVVEKTANLEYQGESGALNESFADVFGAMIDRDDWKIGEDVMQPGVSNSGALRDLQDPNNSAPKNSAFWQPKHTNEKFTGTGDNGGVHINSGIPNHAFYLFANNAAVGKDKAEQVYYKALRDYLVKSSQFVDCRIAVVQAAKDLYGTTVADIAANAFTAVGIGGNQPSGNYQGQLTVNPGKDFIYITSNDFSKLDLALGNGTVLGTIYDQGLRSRPSVTDNGTEAVFVNDAGQLMLVTLEFNPSGTIVPTVDVLENQTIWHNVAISKDGRFIAYSTEYTGEVRDNRIYVYDFVTQKEVEYELYNPTYTQGQITGDVRYSDVLEFDYSGENVMYDAYSELPNGQNLGYWDIGFLQFWENGQFADPLDPFISKLFSGLPDNTSVGNPAIAKNSPYVIAFDFIDESTATTRNDIYGANVETGDYNVLVSNNGSLGWPNFTRTDNAILYERPVSSTATNLRLQGLAASKIAPQGTSTALINNRRWGVWFANGNRSLQVSSTDDLRTHIAFNLSISPNPTGDLTQLSLTSPDAEPARLSLSNLLGETLQSRSIELVVGDNQFDLDLSALPAGMYVVHLNTSRAQGAIVVVKR